MVRNGKKRQKPSEIQKEEPGTVSTPKYKFNFFAELPMLMMDAIVNKMEVSEIINLSSVSKRSAKSIRKTRSGPNNMNITIEPNETTIQLYRSNEPEANRFIWNLKNYDPSLKNYDPVLHLQHKVQYYPNKKINRRDAIPLKGDEIDHPQFSYSEEEYSENEDGGSEEIFPVPPADYPPIQPKEESNYEYRHSDFSEDSENEDDEYEVSSDEEDEELFDYRTCRKMERPKELQTKHFKVLDVEVKHPPYNKFFSINCYNLDQSVGRVITHLLQTFPHCRINKLKVKLSNSSFKVQNALSAVSSCRTLQIRKNDEKGPRDVRSQLKYLLENIQVSKELEDMYPLKNHPKVNCRFVNTVEDFRCVHAGWMNGDNLMNLKCKTAALYHTKFEEDDFLNFLKKWQTSNDIEMKEFKWLKIGQKFDMKKLKELNARKPNILRRDKHFRSDKALCCGYDRFICAIRARKCEHVEWITGGLDIQRPDGLLGTVFRHNDRYTCFYVWHERFQYPYYLEYWDGRKALIEIRKKRRTERRARQIGKDNVVI